MEDLEALVASSEFAAVKSAVEALDPMLMLDQRVAPHINALRTGMGNLEKALAAIAAAAPPEEPEPEEEPVPDEPEGEPDEESEE